MACLSPFNVTLKLENRKVPVPCGKCAECRKRRISAWSFRLRKEGERSSSNLFVTLTYSPENVPISKNKFMTLCKRDVQLFFKRLRKLHEAGYCGGCIKKLPKIKYYAVGEYGTTTNRPHYHIIMFNAYPDLVVQAWKLKSKEIGHVHIGNLTPASIGYTLKYVCKPSRIPLHRNDDRIPEFSLMSKSMGLNYITDETLRWHYADLENRQYITIEDGKRIALPRYYRQKMYDKILSKHIGTQSQIKHEQREELELQYKLQEYDGDIGFIRHMQSEAQIAAFGKMHRDALKNRDTI